MGADKALVEYAGRPLVCVARDALLGAGAVEVVAVGGDGDRLAALGGLRPVPDLFPGEGPLGAVITALQAGGCGVVVVLACDLPRVDSRAVAELLAALGEPSVDAAVAEAGGHVHGVVGAYRPACLPWLQAAFGSGTRSIRDGLGGLAVARVRLSDPVWLTDTDDPVALTAAYPVPD